ncbi:MAG: hypothetical protein E7643_01270 [Ruminococcaceae bacterium]|nr:hypothetical protein [Oscillospiraceae bacterium]
MLEKNRRLCAVFAIAFVLVETALGILLQCAHGATVRISSFLSIVIACLFCVFFVQRSRSYVFTQAALLFTVGADFFLVLLPERQQLSGMVCFLCTQLFYFLRLYFEDEKKVRRHRHAVLRVAVTLMSLLLTGAVLGEKTDALAIVSMAYYANLLLNIVFSFLQNGWRSLFSWGLVLFVLCDTLIGIASMGPYITLPADSFVWTLMHPGFDLAWAFYLPSQMLLSMSLLKKSE